jgi:hypothetical protein
VTLKIVTPVATLCIAAFVAIIGFNQWRISREKLRLDLFNRRFDIYLRVLDYYGALLKEGGGPTTEQTVSFLKAVRESRFIFPKVSEVHRFLEEFWTRANDFFIDAAKRKAGVSVHNATDKFQWLLDAMKTLEEKMEPYMQFERL